MILVNNMSTKMKNIISIKTIFLISILLLTIIGFNKFSNDMMESIFLENAVNDDFGSSLGTTLYLKDMNGEIITVGSVEEFERYFSKSRIRLKREYSFVVDFSEINKFKEKQIITYILVAITNLRYLKLPIKVLILFQTIMRII